MNNSNVVRGAFYAMIVLRGVSLKKILFHVSLYFEQFYSKIAVSRKKLELGIPVSHFLIRNIQFLFRGPKIFSDPLFYTETSQNLD